LALAMCGRALSCWNVAPFAAIKGSNEVLGSRFCIFRR
jgi:hypothetical protein